MDIADLKPEHRIFAHEYVIDWNGTRSYKVAYPNVGDNTAAVNATKLLRNTKIAEYIEHIQKDIGKLAGVSALGNIKKLLEIAKKTAAKDSDKIKALEVVNKMVGLNAPDKIEQTNTNIKPRKVNWTRKK